MDYDAKGTRLTLAPGFLHRLTRALLVLPFALAGAACDPRSAPEADDVAFGRPLDLPWLGCAAIVVDGTEAVCEFSGPVRLRIPDESEISVRPPNRLVDREGALVTIAVADGATSVAARISGRTSGIAAIRVRPATTAAWWDEARAQRQRGDVDGARSAASTHAEAPDPIERARAKGLLARIDLAAGRTTDAFALFREAIAAHRSAGHLSEAADDAFALAFALHQRSQRYAEARAVLDAAHADVGLYGEGRARERYYAGILAAEIGDRRGALRDLRAADAMARDFGMARLARNAESALALEILALGEAGRAADVLARLEKDLDAATNEPATPCERVAIANNLGWARSLEEAAPLTPGAPRPVGSAREAVLRAVALEGCADVYERSFALTNLARVHLAADEGEAATKALAEARAAVREPRGVARLAWIDLDARIAAAARRNDEALRRFDEELRLARAARLALPQWSALVGKAGLLAATGRRNDAIDALLAAESVLDDATLLVPLGEGRSGFASDHGQSARLAVALLVEGQRFDEAVHVARNAQARVVASAFRHRKIATLPAAERARWERAVEAWRTAREALEIDAATDWKRSGADLARVTRLREASERAHRAELEAAIAALGSVSPTTAPSRPATGVVEIDVHPARQAFLAIVRDETSTIGFVLRSPLARPRTAAGAPSTGALAAALFGPVHAKLARATVVRVRARGAWRDVDVHALPFDDAPLLAHARVEYPVGDGDDGRPPTDAGHAVVVGDPTSDLPSAFDEANAVANALGSGVRVLLREEATSTAVTSALDGARHLHYAGHATFDGLDGFASVLPLARGGRLTIGDILALRRGPRTVVLSSCEAARSEGETEALGLAQAFLAIGSAEVLAPTRKVDDTLAARLAGALHFRADDPPRAAMQRAILALRAAMPEGDWAAFRILTP